MRFFNLAPLRAQFRLRTLFAAVTVLAVALAILAAREQRYRLRVEASVIFARRHTVCGYVNGHKDSDSYRYFGDENQLLPGDVVVDAHASHDISDEEIAALLCFPTLRWLDLYESTLTDQQLAKVSALKRLERFDLHETGVSDVGVGYLRDMGSLRILNLSATKVTGIAFKHLGSLSELQELDLHDTPLGDEGARCLGALTSLRKLNISGTNVTDQGVRNLAAIASLRVLNVSSTRVTGSGLEHLACLAKLRELVLRETCFSDASARFLPTLLSLRDLNISCTSVSGSALSFCSQMSLRGLDLNGCAAISDTDLPQLAGCQRLSSVNLTDTAVTAAGAARLHTLLPHALIRWGPIMSSTRIEPEPGGETVYSDDD